MTVKGKKPGYSEKNATRLFSYDSEKEKNGNSEKNATRLFSYDSKRKKARQFGEKIRRGYSVRIAKRKMSFLQAVLFGLALLLF